MKTYEKYKDSGIEWIGKIPEHWEVKKIKHFSNVLTGATPKSTEESFWNGSIKWVTTDDLGKLESKNIFDSRRKITKEGYENSGTTLAPENSIIISTRAPIGHLGILKVNACTNQGCKTIVSNINFDSQYLYYFLSVSKTFLKSLGVGTTFLELPTQSLKDFTVPFPKKQEQIAIANYLDRKTTEIDQLIADKQQLVTLYQEEKTAIINQAVTKGITPEVQLKDSGIEWLGKIPEHWEVEKVKRFIQIKRGAGYQYIKEVFLDTPYEYVLRISDFNNYNPIRAHYIEGFDKYRVLKDDILIAGTGASAGITMYVDSSMDGMVHSYNALRIFVSNKKELNSKFLFYSLRSHSLTEQMNIAFTGSAQHFLDVQRISDFIITLPSETEQEQIVEHIEKESARIDGKIAKAKAYIKLLTEYRTALISEVVTGKVKVSF